MGGGGSSQQVTYQQPSDPYGDALKKYQLEQLQEETAATKKAEEEKKKASAEKQKAAEDAFADYYSSVKGQLGSGLYTYTEAKAAIDDYVKTWDLSPKAKDLQDLTKYYTETLAPEQQKSQISAAYQELLGETATKTQISEAQEKFKSGYYKSVSDLKDALKLNEKYQDKFNKSYLDNYYETMFGKATKDKTGTKQYTFKLNEALVPKYEGDLAAETGVKLPEYKTEVTGTAGEIEANLDAIKETKQFIYSAGLSNLQGNIDKEVQKLKNEGGQEVAKIQGQGTILSSLVGSFNF